MKRYLNDILGWAFGLSLTGLASLWVWLSVWAGHPMVLRFTPGPGGGGIPPGFFANLASPWAGGMLVQGGLAIGLGFVLGRLKWRIRRVRCG